MSQVSQERDCTKTEARAAAKAIILLLIKAFKDAQLYPATNPVVIESIKNSVQALKDVLGKQESAELLVDKGYLFLDGISAGANESRIAEFSLFLYRRGIHKLIFNPYLEFEEMRSLLGILAMKPEEIEESGGIAYLLGEKGIIGTTVESKGDLAIVDGAKLSVSEQDLLELESIRDLELTAEQLSSPRSFSRIFAEVEGGDLANIERLRALLGNPELFSILLEKFAVKRAAVEKTVDPTSRVETMLEILRSVGAAVTSLPSTNERAQLLENLSLSVRNLSTNSRNVLVNQGIVPNLSVNSVESNILSRFPVQNLTDVLCQNFRVGGGTASVMASYFKNLDFTQVDRSELAGALRNMLKQDEMLTPQVEAVLASEEAKSAPSKKDAVRGAPMPDVPVFKVEGYPAEKIVFKADERAELGTRMGAELAAPDAAYMIPSLLTLFRYESIPANLAVIIERATLYIEHLFATGNQEVAIDFINALHIELENKAKELGETQLETVKKGVEKIDQYLGEQGIKPRIEALRKLSRENPEFNEIVTYFGNIGSPAVIELFNVLEDEESRHVRLLICEAIAQIGERAIETIAEQIDHPNWHVVRNAVSVLGQIGSPECVPALRAALSHEEFRVRKAALKSLAAVRTDEAIQEICSRVNSADSDTCRAALSWVAVMEAEQALPMLKQLLGDSRIWKLDEDILHLAIEALGNIDSEEATVFLEQLRRKRSILRRRKSGIIRKSARAELTKDRENNAHE
jgi:hypothetical protein